MNHPVVFEQKICLPLGIPLLGGEVGLHPQFTCLCAWGQTFLLKVKVAV